MTIQNNITLAPFGVQQAVNSSNPLPPIGNLFSLTQNVTSQTVHRQELQYPSIKTHVSQIIDEIMVEVAETLRVRTFTSRFNPQQFSPSNLALYETALNILIKLPYGAALDIGKQLNDDPADLEQLLQKLDSFSIDDPSSFNKTDKLFYGELKALINLCRTLTSNETKYSRIAMCDMNYVVSVAYKEQLSAASKDRRERLHEIISQVNKAKFLSTDSLVRKIELPAHSGVKALAARIRLVRQPRQ